MSWHNYILNLATPLVKYLGKVHLPFTVKKIDGEFYFKYLKKLKPGDVILSTTKGQLSNLYNPTKFKHCAMYLGEIDGIPYVIEATAKGVIKTDLVTHFLTKDEIKILRPVFLNAIDHKFINENAYQIFQGTAYDYMFTKGNNSYYCYELAVCILETVSNIIIYPKDSFFRKPYYGPKTFLNDKKSFKEI